MLQTYREQRKGSGMRYQPAQRRVEGRKRRIERRTVRTAIFSPFSIVSSLSSFSKIHLAPLFPILSHLSLSSSHTPTATSTTFFASV